jgi:DNA-binding transcriptional MerR regulator
MRVHHTQKEVQFRGERWVKTGRAALLLNVSSGTVVTYAEEGLLISFQARRGAHRLISLSSIKALLLDWMSQKESSNKSR